MHFFPREASRLQTACSNPMIFSILYYVKQAASFLTFRLFNVSMIFLMLLKRLYQLFVYVTYFPLALFSNLLMFDTDEVKVQH